MRPPFAGRAAGVVTAALLATVAAAPAASAKEDLDAVIGVPPSGYTVAPRPAPNGPHDPASLGRVTGVEFRGGGRGFVRTWTSASPPRETQVVIYEAGDPDEARSFLARQRERAAADGWLEFPTLPLAPASGYEIPAGDGDGGADTVVAAKARYAMVVTVTARPGARVPDNEALDIAVDVDERLPDDDGRDDELDGATAVLIGAGLLLAIAISGLIVVLVLRNARRDRGAAPPTSWVSGAPPGWQPDPSGRHQLRWWDGTRWTEHVADNGLTSTDPVS